MRSYPADGDLDPKKDLTYDHMNDKLLLSSAASTELAEIFLDFFSQNALNTTPGESTEVDLYVLTLDHGRLFHAARRSTHVGKC